jgi:hypothetical protein
LNLVYIAAALLPSVSLPILLRDNS